MKGSYGVFVLCGLVAACGAKADSAARMDEPTKTCSFVSGKLAALGGGLHRQINETFEHDGKIYRGCVVTIVGDATKAPGNRPPAHNLYPGPDSSMAKAGWKADREADGPDGTSYRIYRNDVFCAVDGWWDGGDDGDAENVPSPLFLVTVKCARN